MKFVLELGAEEAIDGGAKRWRSDGFYAGYEVKGPIIVDSVTEAYEFPNREYASNVQKGDERFKSSRILVIDP